MSFEIAKRLAASGLFPKPKPAFGQYWYSKIWNAAISEYEHPLCICVERYLVGNCGLRRIECAHSGNDYAYEFVTYVPTPEEMLTILNRACQSGHWAEIHGPSDGVFEVCIAERGDSTVVSSGATILEALANAILTPQIEDGHFKLNFTK